MNEEIKFKNLILIRHGENIEVRSINNDLLPLSFNGICQSKKAAIVLKNKFDIILCSNSRRAIHTAKIISDKNNLIIDSRLIERGWGNSNKDGLESDEEARNRLRNLFNDIYCKYKDKRILLVSHGALIKLAQDVIENQTLPRDRVSNCTIIEYDNKMQKNILNIN